MRLICGNAFVFGDRVDTDLLAPGAFMKRPLPELAQHCLQALDPGFAGSVRSGDVLVAGVGFGIGSSREQAAEALKYLGIGCVVARSVARIFYRNAINLGLPVLLCPDWGDIRAGDSLQIDLSSGVIDNARTRQRFQANPMPAFLLDLLDDGGLVPHLQRRFAR